MSTFTLPPELASLLGQFRETTELRDTEGKVIGVFMPCGETKEERWDRIKGLFDLEEAKRTLAAERGQGYTWDEVKRHLQSLAERE